MVQGQPNGETKFTSELAGGPDDPMFQQRKAIFEPLSQEVMAFVESKLGKKSRNEAPRRAGPATRHTLASKLETCPKCQSPVAFLVFSEDYETEGDLEDAARIMYYQIREHNVPTWVIGEISGAGNPMENSTILKKVWPEREAMFEASPREFNLMLEGLVNRHCG